MAEVNLVEVRVDRWLCAVRAFKSRTLAASACNRGQVKVNGKAVRASHSLRVGDEVRARPPRGDIVFVVLGLADKRLSAKAAQLLYEDHSPPPVPQELPVFRRERGSGRPTKHDRRKLERLRRT